MKEKIILKNGPLEDESSSRKANLRRRILLVDDEPLILQLNTEVLVASGYEIDTAEDGAAAWEVLQLNSYHLLITDNEMPKVSGVDLLKKLHADPKAMLVIMATGTLPTWEFAQYPWLLPAAILLKPYTIAELLATVKKVLHATASAVKGDQLSGFHDMTDDKIPQTKEPASPSIRSAANLHQRILVVDDNTDTRQLSIDMLVCSGYDVEGVEDGADGWAALQANNYDLVITDNQMPRMTGIEMITKARASRMELPIIMATGHLPVEEFARKPWLKPDAMLQRPFSNDELLATVKNILRTDDGSDGHGETLLTKYL